ncbi:vitamin B12 transporter [Verrucomicrobium sp. GAS474]|uniref:TonB-dependent receptor plug domain-containing protein n=1 Tax=Verrucomicrobium sp. GAS474 TaxID=1882831 RepID=UPI00087CDF24|nr:TonB-dependent receptor plug domain-containing protein [Verrucomicrobium sp. GAS474]SDT99444.1 vitamin B12 transporter [Verrucomicrobium sp. GAS474]
MQRISVRGLAFAIALALPGLGSLQAASTSSKTSSSTSATSSAPASSATDDTTDLDLDPVIVTATRIPEPLSQTSSSVTVISAKEIEDNGYQNVVQALQNVPGLRTATPGTPGQVTGVFIRGMNSNQTLVLIDGKRLPQGFDGAYDITDLPLDNVERIEVARGPLSAVQGNSAAGGVINIITKSGQGMKKPEYAVTVEAGSFNTFHETVSARGAQGKFDYSAAYSSLLTSNQRRNNDYDRENATANLGYQAYDDVRLSLASAYRVTTVQNPGSVPSSSLKKWQQWETWSVSPTLDWKTTEAWSQSLSFQHSQQRMANDNEPSANNRQQVNSNEVDWNHTITPIETLSIAAGGQFEDKTTWQYDDSLRSLTYNNHQTNKNVHTGVDWEALPGWHLVPSVSLDGYSDYGDFFNWRAATSYVVPATKTKFLGSYGTSTTAPSDQNFLTYGGFQIPNFNLKPEQTRGWEAGAEQPFFGGKWTVGGTFFENSIDNLIYTPVATPLNLRHTRTQGVEVTTGIHPIKELDITAAYTYLDAINTDTMARLVRRPRNETSFDVTGRPAENVTLALGGSWLNGMQDTDAATFATFNPKNIFSTRFAATWKITSNVSVFGRIENLLNNHYEEIPGYPTLSQAFYAGFKLTY